MKCYNLFKIKDILMAPSTMAKSKVRRDMAMEPKCMTMVSMRAVGKMIELKDKAHSIIQMVHLTMDVGWMINHMVKESGSDSMVRNTKVTFLMDANMALAKKPGLMDPAMKAPIKRESELEKEFTDGRMVLTMMEISKMMLFKEKECILGQMERCTLETGKVDRCTGMACINGPMEEPTKANFSEILNMAMEYTHNRQDSNIWVNLKTVNKMVLEKLLLQMMELKGKDSGKKEKDYTGRINKISTICKIWELYKNLTILWKWLKSPNFGILMEEEELNQLE